MSELNTPEMETTWIFDCFDDIVQHKYISLMSLIDDLEEVLMDIQIILNTEIFLISHREFDVPLMLFFHFSRQNHYEILEN
jgi:hypothetical protein